TRSFPTWFHPRARFFAGREDRLPVDANLLVAMIAPRAILMEWGHNDEVSNVRGGEQTYHSGLKVYKLLGQPDRIGVLRVPGFHGANDQEACLDWLDIQFGRSTRTWNNVLYLPWDFEKWRAQTRQSVPALPDVRKAMEWALGDAPPRMPPAAGRGAFGGRG